MVSAAGVDSFSSVTDETVSGTIGVEAVIKEPAGISVVTEGASSEVADGFASVAVASEEVSAGAESSESFFDFSLDGDRSEVMRADRRRPSLA